MPAPYDFSRHLAHVEGLFPLPQVLARAAAKARDPESTVDEVADVLVLDPSIVRTVVALSNSSYFNCATKSESLKEAVQRIGLQEILRLVGCGIAQAVYQRELARYRIPPEVFWESGIAAALLMEGLARARGEATDDAYLAGLMREIGMVVINHVLTAERDAAQWDCYAPVREWELAATGRAHPDVGAELLACWGFSTAVVEAVRHQWAPDSSGSELAGALHLTNLLLERSGCDFSLPVPSFAPFAAAAERLGLTAGELAAAHRSAADAFRRLRGELGAARGR